MENTCCKFASLLVVLLGKALSGISSFVVVDRWPATSNRARYSILINLSGKRIYM